MKWVLGRLFLSIVYYFLNSPPVLFFRFVIC